MCLENTVSKNTKQVFVKRHVSVYKMFPLQSHSSVKKLRRGVPGNLLWETLLQPQKRIKRMRLWPLKGQASQWSASMSPEYQYFAVQQRRQADNSVMVWLTGGVRGFTLHDQQYTPSKHWKYTSKKSDIQIYKRTSTRICFWSPWEFFSTHVPNTFGLWIKDAEQKCFTLSPIPCI